MHPGLYLYAYRASMSSKNGLIINIPYNNNYIPVYDVQYRVLTNAMMGEV